MKSFRRRSVNSALAMMSTKEPGKAFFINYALDVTPICDCYGWTDTPIVNGLGESDYTLKEVEMDRSRETIDRFYPYAPAAKLKQMYAREHPLKGLDTASFGRLTEGVAEARHPKKQVPPIPDKNHP